MNTDVGEGSDADMIPAKGDSQSLCSLHCAPKAQNIPTRSLGEKTERQILKTLGSVNQSAM